MKVIVAFFFILLLSECKKDIQNNSVPNYWSLDGVKYNALQLGLNNYFYVTHDSSGNSSIFIKFALDTITQGTYSVADYQTSVTNLSRNGCVIWGATLKNSQFVTTGKSGDVVNVTKNSNGTFSFIFNNISVTDSLNNILEVSGNLTSY